MRYNTFIKESAAVSEIGVGAWQLGKSNAWESITDKEAIELVHKAIDMGINFFDTAPNYGFGTSEERLGKALAEYDRDQIVINTKFGHNANGELNFESGNIRISLEDSLKRMKTDYVDSLIIHNPPIEYLDGNRTDHYEILESLKQEGKIKEYGASIDTYEEMKTFISTTNGKVVEIFFNILHQDVRKAFDLAKNRNVGIIVKIPLDSGWLTGKYDNNSTFNDIRKRWTQKDIQTRADLVEQVKSILPEHKDLSQQAIAFCLSYDAVSTVIPGNKNIEQLINNIKSTEIKLSEDDIKALEDFYNEKVESLKLPW